MQAGSGPARFSGKGCVIYVQIPQSRPRAGGGAVPCARGTHWARQQAAVLQPGGGLDSAELEPRWDTCGFGEPGASGGCCCVPRTPAQVTIRGAREARRISR